MESGKGIAKGNHKEELVFDMEVEIYVCVQIGAILRFNFLNYN